MLKIFKNDGKIYTYVLSKISYSSFPYKDGIYHCFRLFKNGDYFSSHNARSYSEAQELFEIELAGALIIAYV